LIVADANGSIRHWPALGEGASADQPSSQAGPGRAYFQLAGATAQDPTHHILAGGVAGPNGVLCLLDATTGLVIQDGYDVSDILLGGVRLLTLAGRQLAVAFGDTRDEEACAVRAWDAYTAEPVLSCDLTDLDGVTGVTAITADGQDVLMVCGYHCEQDGVGLVSLMPGDDASRLCSPAAWPGPDTAAPTRPDAISQTRFIETCTPDPRDPGAVVLMDGAARLWRVTAEGHEWRLLTDRPVGGEAGRPLALATDGRRLSILIRQYFGFKNVDISRGGPNLSRRRGKQAARIGRHGATLDGSPSADIVAVDLSPSGDVIVAGGEDGCISIWRGWASPPAVIRLEDPVHDLKLVGGDSIVVCTGRDLLSITLR
jgi:WD40 repeat protein